MSRSSWKPLFIHPEIISQSVSKKENPEFILFNRNTLLTEEMLEFKFYVYNGIRFFVIDVNMEKIGHHLGEFSPSKKKTYP